MKFYKKSIPKTRKKIKNKAEKLLTKKYCSCIEKVKAKPNIKGREIGICTNSVIKKGFKRGRFTCKKKKKVYLYKGGRHKKKTRKKRGGYNELPPIILNKQEFIDMLRSDPDKSYQIMRNVRCDGMDDIDDPEHGYNEWYTGKITYNEFNDDSDEDTFVFDIYDEDGNNIGWEDLYQSLTHGPDTDSLDYEWTNIKSNGSDIILQGGRKRRKKQEKDT